MSEEEQVQQETDEQVTATDTDTADQYQELSKKIEQIEERYKKEIAGLNRRNSELEKTLNKKTEVEKTAEQKIEEMQQQLRQKEIRELRITKAGEAGYPGMAKLFDFDTTSEDGIENFMGHLNTIVDEMVAKKYEALVK